MKEGWERTRLGEVCEFQRGLTYSRKDVVDFSENIVLRATNINLKNNCLDFIELKYLNNSFLVKENKKLVKGALLICLSSGSKSHLGKIALVDHKYDYAFGGFIGQIIPNVNIHSKYLFYNLISERYKTYISELTDGININNLKSVDLKNFEILLPPLPEQQRIVAILDKAFTAINKAKANAEQNLLNSKELFESYLQGVFDNKGDDWEEKTLGEILSSPPKNGWSPPAKFHSSFGIPVLTLSAVTGFIFKKECVKYTSAPVKHDAYYWLDKGDLLMTRSNAPELVGHIAICESLDVKTIYPDLMMKINPNNSIVNTRFLYYQLKSPKLRKIITGAAHGANPTMKKINKQDVESFEISYPSLFEQQQIVKKLNSLSTETKKLEAIYRQKITDLNELKKSILQKAFSGEL